MSTMEGDDGGIGEGTAQRPSPRVDRHTKPPHHFSFYRWGGGLNRLEIPLNQPKELPLLMFIGLIELLNRSILDQGLKITPSGLLG